MKGISLRMLLIAALLIPVMLAVGTTGIVSYSYGQLAVRQLVTQLQHEVSDSVNEQLVAYLQTPHTVNQLNVDALQSGLLDKSDFDALEGHFWRQMRVFEPASYIQLGRADGYFVGVERNADQTFNVEVTNAEGTGKGVFIADARGRHSGPQLAFVDAYDARSRPWFKAARDAGGPTWSPIYQFSSRDSARLGITAVQPYNELEGGFAGVVGTDIVLAQLGTFLDSPRLGRHGQIYVVERDGMLVASSVMDPPFEVDAEKKAHRVAAVQAPDLTTRETAKELAQDGWPDGEFVTEVDGERVFVQTSTFRDGRGINWVVVVVLPASEFMAEIQANAVRTLLLCVLALVLSGILGIWISHWLATPVAQLQRAADGIAKGQWDKPVPSAGASEIAQLAASFVSMRAQLQTSQQELKWAVDLRTRDMEEAEQAQDVAESANRAKSTFLANMSHELRTPMVAVIGYSEMLIEDAGAQPKEEMVTDLQRIRTSGMHLLKLIDDVLDLSAIEVGRIPLNAERVDIAELVESVVGTLRPVAEKSRTELQYHVSPDAGCLMIDRRRLEQCLLNLVANSLKFTKGGRVAVGVSTGLADVSFSIEDSGIGIAPDDLERIFQPFAQVDDSSTKTRGGTGLGLAITKDLVEMMGGQIAVSSAVGKGTTFVVRFPKAGL